MERETFVHALIGAVLNVVLAPIVPFGTVVGGGVAGYLDGGERRDGVIVGALAGALSIVPFFLIVAFLGNVAIAMFIGGVGIPASFGALGVVFFIIAVLSTAAYTVAFSAIGGWLGNYVRYDTEIDI